jgi:hypothetical protein
MRGKTLLAVFALGILSATFAPADEWNRKIEFTFNKPVSIPAVHQPGWGTLPAGTYVFKIMDSSSDRHIVQIFNKEETTIYATILAIPNMRLTATDKVVLTFRETPIGQPVALKGMFYPGRQWGEEFVYPKVRATEIARATNETVLSMPATMEKEASMPESPAVVAELQEAPLTAVNPAGEEVQTAEVVTPPTPAEVLVARNEELPKTASPLPLFALLGMLALGGGMALTEKRRSTKSIG